MAEYEARYDRFRPNPKPNAWGERAQPGSGLLFDLGPHLIDQALLLFGAPLAITASAFRQREWSVVEDAFDVCLEYSWWRAMLRSRSIAYAPGPHFVIHGTQGSFEKYGMDPQEEPLRKGQAPDGFDWGPHWGEDPERQWGTLSLTVGDSAQKVKSEPGDYRGFYANLRDAVTQGARAGGHTRAGSRHHACRFRWPTAAVGNDGRLLGMRAGMKGKDDWLGEVRFIETDSTSWRPDIPRPRAHS